MGSLCSLYTRLCLSVYPSVSVHLSVYRDSILVNFGWKSQVAMMFCCKMLTTRGLEDTESVPSVGIKFIPTFSVPPYSFHTTFYLLAESKTYENHHSLSILNTIINPNKWTYNQNNNYESPIYILEQLEDDVSKTNSPVSIRDGPYLQNICHHPHGLQSANCPCGHGKNTTAFFFVNCLTSRFQDEVAYNWKCGILLTFLRHVCIRS
jgi:hypothetical protein